jgi:hypothetical protein
VVLEPGKGYVELDDHPTGLFEQAWRSQARLEGMLSHAVGRTDIDDAKVDQARREQWSDAISDALGLVPYADLILGDVPEGLTRRALELALSKGEASAVDASTSWLAPSAADADATRSAKDASRRAEYQAFMAIVTSGLAAPELTSELLHDDGSPLTYEEYSHKEGAKSDLLGTGNFDSLMEVGGFGDDFNTAFHVYYPKA